MDSGKAQGMGEYVENIRSMTLVNARGYTIDLNTVEINNLSKDVAERLQAIDPAMFSQLKALQGPIVQSQMTEAYAMVFGFCAIAYLLAWGIMKSLVPKFKPINDL